MSSDSRTTVADATFVRTVCGFMVALVLSTWRLWTGQTIFPQVPLFEFAVDWPRWIDHLSLTALLAALIATIVAAARPLRRWTLAAAMASLAILWITDQHRLQPWAYHFAISSVAIAFLPSPSHRAWLRALAISVYVYSALSKFDARFLQTSGALMVATGLEWIGVDADRLPPGRLSNLAIALPAGELVTGVLLALPACRRLGRWSAAVLHVALVLLLGPWGLNHRAAVLIWNIAFLVQVWMLFDRPGNTAERRAGAERSARAGRRSCPAAAVPLLAAIVLPSFEPFGLWDSWLSWGLYSTRAAKLDVFLPSDVVPRLPPPIRGHLDSGSADARSFWTRVAIDRWSLETLEAPIYPQQRFQLGVALAIVQMLPADERGMLIVASSPPDRRSGWVRKEQWSSDDNLQAQAARYFFNVQPRRPVIAGSDA